MSFEELIQSLLEAARIDALSSIPADFFSLPGQSNVPLEAVANLHLVRELDLRTDKLQRARIDRKNELMSRQQYVESLLDRVSQLRSDLAQPGRLRKKRTAKEAELRSLLAEHPDRELEKVRKALDLHESGEQPHKAALNAIESAPIRPGVAPF